MFDKANMQPLEKHVHLAIATPHPEIERCFLGLNRILML